MEGEELHIIRGATNYPRGVFGGTVNSLDQIPMLVIRPLTLTLRITLG